MTLGAVSPVVNRQPDQNGRPGNALSGLSETHKKRSRRGRLAFGPG
jgi:hypothetical protein